MARSPAVLLLDDGELDDVQTLLEEIRIPYGRVRGGAIAQRTPAPTRLLVLPFVPFGQPSVVPSSSERCPPADAPAAPIRLGSTPYLAALSRMKRTASCTSSIMPGHLVAGARR